MWSVSRLINRWLNSRPELDRHPEAVIHYQALGGEKKKKMIFTT